MNLSNAVNDALDEPVEVLGVLTTGWARTNVIVTLRPRPPLVILLLFCEFGSS
ncbi:hypothetical protein [Mycobacterium colombiense]|uniref:hypothetical protein n=1 Tax=Mycobacterium colombiense TaxID=339268 RepID=UPI0014033D55|nr:hypothetical protein [Mycobacterium colombiense]